MPPTILCMGNGRGGSFTGFTADTVSCRCTCFAGINYWSGSFARPTSMPPSIHFPPPGRVRGGEDSVRVDLPTTHGIGTFLLSRGRLEALRLCLEAALDRAGDAPAGASPDLGSCALRVTEDPSAEATAQGHQVHLGLPTTDGTYSFLLSRESAASIVWFLDHVAAAEKNTK